MPRSVRSLLAALLLLTVLLAGCADRSPAWIDRGNSYTSSSVRDLLDKVDTSKLAKTPTEAAQGLRQDALVALRNRGSGAVDAATLITATFPADTRAVPVYVEKATVGGRSALIVIEAWGPAGAMLSLERLWVLDSNTGDVIDSAAVR